MPPLEAYFLQSRRSPVASVAGARPSPRRQRRRLPRSTSRWTTPTSSSSSATSTAQWVDADGGKTVAVTDPGTGKQLGTVPGMGEAETARAIAAAERALPGWRAKTAGDRAKILRRLFDLMIEHQDALGELLSREQGKPFSEAKGEIVYGAGFIEWFAEEGKRAYGEVIPSHAADRRIVTLKQPVGVVAAITPWNFPTAMITRKLGPALAAGCTIVIKPASATPFSALALAALCEEAGVPAGVVNVVTGSARAIGGELTRNPSVRKLTFTGSTEIGVPADARMCRYGEEDQHGAGRQRAVPGVRRRRCRRGDRRRDDLQVPQRRPDLRLHQPLLRPGRRL